MAGRSPTPDDIQLPGIQGARPVAGIDPSGYAHGAQALSQGVQNLGQGIEKSANTLQEYNLYKLRNQALLAQDSIIGNVIQAREEFRHDTDYGTLTERWDKRVKDIVDSGIKDVPEGPLRDHVTAKLLPPLARTREQIEEYSFSGRKQTAHADLYARANNLVQTTGPYDDPLHTAQVDAFNSQADQYAASGLMTPLEVQQHKQNLALHLADARARARINMGPDEAAKVVQELRNSIPRDAPSMYQPGGWSSTDHAASVVSRAETSDPDLGPRALGNISRDTNGSKSYGFMGLNSGSGSAALFARLYGRPFGLTARPGSAEFDEQWKAAAGSRTPEFRDAQLRYFNEHVVPFISQDLQRAGVPQDAASDPRVITYFADRRVQMGTYGQSNIEPAWRGANGDVVKFLRNMNAIDGTEQQWQANFSSAIRTGVYPYQGHLNRLDTRLAGALSTPTGPNAAAGQTVAAARPPAGGTLLPVPPVYSAAPGDTVESVAARFNNGATAGVTPQEIAQANGITADNPLRPGQQLTIPVSTVETRSTQPPAAGAPGSPSEVPRGYSGDPLFQKLTPQHRDALIANAEQMVGQYRNAGIQQLKAGMADDLMAVARDGYVTKPKTLDDFTKVYGEDNGRQAFANYQDNITAATDAFHLRDKTPDEVNAVLERYRPRQGEPDFAEREQRFQKMEKVANDLREDLKKDPADYMLRNVPAVRDAYQKFAEAAGGDPQAQAQAAQNYASTMIAEQKRMGVPADRVKIVRDDYADRWRTQIEKLSKDGNGGQIAFLIKNEWDKWGSSWPEVYRQITAGDPMLRVVGAGVKSSAAQLLTENRDIKFADIVKDEQSAKAKDIREGVDGALTPFASSLAGSGDAIRLYNDVRGQVEKLAALYSFQHGMDATDAAKQAADDVLNFKYDFRDGYRIPNGQDTRPAGVSPDQIQAGAAMAKMFLGRENVAGIDLRMKPAIDTIGAAYTPAQLAAETADAKRYGRWATNADESGLVFIYGYQHDWKRKGYQVVRRPDGTPLQLTWSQLADIAKNVGTSEQAFKNVGGPL
jgi:LysM repeat protein